LYCIRSNEPERFFSTLGSRDSDDSYPEVLWRQEQNEPCPPKIEHLLKPDSTWSYEDWNLAQDFLDTDFSASSNSSAQEHLSKSLALIRRAQRQNEPSDSPMKLSLHKTIGLWHYHTVVNQRPKGHPAEDGEADVGRMTPRDWVGMVDDHPNVFGPHTLANLSVLVHAAMKRNDSDLAVSLLDRMIGQLTKLFRHNHYGQESSFYTSPSVPTPTSAQSLVQLTIHNALQAYATKDDLESTLNMFAKYQPYVSRNGYNAVLLALAKRGHGQHAEQLLADMCKGYCVDGTGQVISPDLRSFNLTLSAWSQCTSEPSAPERAHAILLRLCDPFDWGALGISPDDVSWNTILKAWARSERPDAVSSAISLLKDMEGYDQAGMSEARPTIIAYGTVLDAIAKRGQAEVAERLWLDMYYARERDPERAAVPNWVSATCVIQAWSQSKRLDRAYQAKDWFRRVQSLIHEEPDTAVYHALFSCCASVPTVEAAQLAEELLQSN
jgi:hypothetical protein